MQLWRHIASRHTAFSNEMNLLIVTPDVFPVSDILIISDVPRKHERTDSPMYEKSNWLVIPRFFQVQATQKTSDMSSSVKKEVDQKSDKSQS